MDLAKYKEVTKKVFYKKYGKVANVVGLTIEAVGLNAKLDDLCKIIVDALKDELTEEEANILRRGRNAKPYTKAKNASYGEYCKATGLEALVGYLYLKGETNRAVSLIKTGLDKAGIEL